MERIDLLQRHNIIIINPSEDMRWLKQDPPSDIRVGTNSGANRSESLRLSLVLSALGAS